jgi:hypothetical protein
MKDGKLAAAQRVRRCHRSLCPSQCCGWMLTNIPLNSTWRLS